MFGHLKGFDMIMDIIENTEVSEEEGKMSASTLNSLT